MTEQSEKMLEAAAFLDDKIREAHGVTKDLRKLIREVKSLVEDEVRKLIQQEVTVQMGRLADETGKAMELATAKVYRRFDRLDRILMGNDRNGEPNLEEVAQEFVSLKRERGIT